MESKDRVLLYPIFAGVILFFLNYMLVIISKGDLSQAAQEVLDVWSFQFMLASSLILIPNLILSFLLWIFSRTKKSLSALTTICFVSIGFGVLPLLYFYYLYYQGWVSYGIPRSMIFYGFPFTYLMGIMLGWFVGMLLTARRS